MSSVKVTWTLPTKRESGRALPVGEIAGTDVSFRVVGAPSFTPVATVLPGDPQETTVNDIDPGDWEFRCVVKDTRGNESISVDKPASVPFSPPNPVASMTVTVS